MVLFALFVLLQVIKTEKHSCRSSVISMRSYPSLYPCASTPLNPFFLPLFSLFPLFFPSLRSFFLSSSYPPLFHPYFLFCFCRVCIFVCMCVSIWPLFTRMVTTIRSRCVGQKIKSQVRVFTRKQITNKKKSIYKNSCI